MSEKNPISRWSERVDAVLAGNASLPDPRKSDPRQRTLLNIEHWREYQEPLPWIKVICHEGYAEPGYTDPPNGLIVTANWNDDQGQIPESFVKEDGDPEELLSIFDALEALGCACEWSDQWCQCNDCRKLVRRCADCYGWRRAFWYDEKSGNRYCLECIRQDPDDYIESLIGNPRSSVTFDLPLEEHGFVKLQEGFESGLHHGQASDPKQIAKSLKKRGIDRFLFVLDGVGQFDVRFSVWADREQLDADGIRPGGDRFDGPLDPSETDKPGLTPAQEMELYLQSAGRAMAAVPPGEGPIITKPDPYDPTKAVAYRVSKEDFIAGKALEGP